MVRGKRTRIRLTGDLGALLPNVASNLPDSIKTDYPDKNWQANAALESKGGLGGSLEFEMSGQRMGQLNIAVGSARATIQIVNNTTFQPRDRTVTDLYDNLPQMTNDFTRLVAQVKPTMQHWLTILGDTHIVESLKASEISKYRLTEDPLKFLSWVREVFPPIFGDVNRFMTTEKDPAKRSLAAALLLQIGRGHRPTGHIQQFLDAPTSVPSRDMSFLHGTVLELLGEKNALLAGKQLEQGDLTAALGTILRGEAIDVERLASGASLGDGAHRSEFGLPADFAKLVTAQGNTITIDLAKMGRDKAGFVLNAVVKGVGQLENLAGVRLYPKYNLTYGGVPAELFPSPDSPLSANALFLAGATGDLKLYPQAVGQRIDKWDHQGYMIATLTGPTGAGKTTLAQTMLRNYIKTMEFQADDVVIYEAKADVDEQGRPKTLNPDRLLSALRQYRALLQQRLGKNKMTALVVDNFHLLPFSQMDDELQRGILNEFDAIGGLLEEGGRTGGVIFLGENLPEGLDMSMLQQHRAEWVDLRLVGKETIFKSAADIFAYKVQKMLQVVRGDILDAARRAGQTKDITQNDIEAILGCFTDYFSQRLDTHNNLGTLASDKNRGPFLTLSHWAGLADSIIPQLQQQAHDYLDTGTSAWLQKDEISQKKGKKSRTIQFTRKGSDELKRQFSTAFDTVHDVASTTADDKLGIKRGTVASVSNSKTTAPPEASLSRSPTQEKTSARETPDQADLAERIRAANHEVESRITALHSRRQSLGDLETQLTQLRQEKDTRMREVQKKYENLFDFFLEEAY